MGDRECQVTLKKLHGDICFNNFINKIDGAFARVFQINNRGTRFYNSPMVMPRLFPCRCFFFSSHGESFGSIDSSFSCKLINIDSDDRRLLSCCSGCRMSVKTSLWPMSSTKNHEKSSLVSFFYIFIDPHCLLKRVVSVLKMCSFSAFVGLRRYVVVFAGLSSVLLYRIGSVASILGVAVRQVLVVVGFGCWSWS